MLQANASPGAFRPESAGHRFHPFHGVSPQHPAALPDGIADEALPDDEDGVIEWSEDDIVFLHWRLLQEIRHLADPATPLEEKLDTLRWVFTEREKDGSAVLVRELPARRRLQPAVADRLLRPRRRREVRDRIRHGLKAWLTRRWHATPTGCARPWLATPNGSRPG
jgi:hypothetical protein